MRNIKTKLSVLQVSFIIFFISNMIFGQHTASKHVSSFIIEAPQLETTKTIWVYLPANYQDSTLRYPVIYMHDAQNLFDNKTSYAGEWKIDEFLDSQTQKQVIIIGIEHGNEKRIDELTPFVNSQYGGGQGEKYILFIKDVLKPYVDKTFRTKKDTLNTTIFGSSLGGLISFYAGIKYSQTFGNVGVFSPSFWFSNAIYDFIETYKIPKYSRFYFLAGTKEGESTITDMEKVIRAIKIQGVSSQNIRTKIVNGGQHNEAFWSQEFPEAFQWIIK